MKTDQIKTDQIKTDQIKTDQMQTLNEHYKNLIENHMPENAQTAAESLAYLEQSTAKYKGELIYSLYMAKIFPEETAEYLKESVETMYKILRKVMGEYLKNPDYRACFGFSPELEQLILAAPSYENLLPICRLDIFFDEETMEFKFCEFNADGCSSMNEDRELNHALKLTRAYQDLEKEWEIHAYDLFDSWAEAFLSIYRSGGYGKEYPNAAIVDFLEKGCSMEEFQQFAESFEKAGMKTQVCEIRDLRFDGEHLLAPDGMVIDAIYRRAVTSDIMEHLDEVEDFMRAVRENKVCLIGSFCTQIIHDKTLFYLLNQPQTYAFLDEAEIAYLKKHIPYTVQLTEREIEKNDVLGTRENWIIKPRDSYGARGIFTGMHLTREQWAQAVEDHRDQDYILQEFVLPYQSWNIDFRKKKPEFRKYSNLTGMFVYDGKFAGFYSRQSEHEIISTEFDENDVASAWAKLR